jgi:hypothetical protein
MRDKLLALAVALGALAGALHPAPARAAVSVGFDLDTLNVLLPALAAHEIAVPIAEGRSVGVRLEDLRVTGLDPAAGGTGHLQTATRVRIPQLGIDVAVTPRLSLHVVDRDASQWLELRFEQVTVPLPLAGSIDVAPFLPPLRFPAENLWTLAGAAGDIEVRSRLTKIDMGLRVLRFDFELETGAGP